MGQHLLKCFIVYYGIFEGRKGRRQGTELKKDSCEAQEIV